MVVSLQARRMLHSQVFTQNTPGQNAGVNRSDAIGLGAYNFDRLVHAKEEVVFVYLIVHTCRACSL